MLYGLSPLQLRAISNFDCSRPLSRIRGMDLAEDFWGPCAGASLETLDSLPTLNPQLQVLADRLSRTLKQARYVHLLVCSMRDLTAPGSFNTHHYHY
jgi:hypothetical protein